MPIVFKQTFNYNVYAQVTSTQHPTKHPLVACKMFFNLEDVAAAAIFMPFHAAPGFGLPALPATANLGDIATQINKYVAAKEEQLSEQKIIFNSIV